MQILDLTYSNIYTMAAAAAGVLFLTLLAVMLIKNRKLKNLTLEYEIMNSLMEVIKKDKSFEKKLMDLLAVLSTVVEAQSYAVYFPDDKKEGFSLKAVRHMVEDDDQIGPAYSGLMPYKKETFLIFPYIPANTCRESAEIIKEGEVSFVFMPIGEMRAVVLIGPVRKIPGGKMRLLRFLSEKLDNILDAFGETEKLKNQLSMEISSGKAVKKGSSIITDFNDISDTAVGIDEQTSDITRKMGRLNKIRNFAVYYGAGKVDYLGGFDTVVIEPGYHDWSEIEKLKNRGTIVLAYLSVMEVHEMTYGYNMLRQEDYLTIDGSTVVNGEYGNKLVDLCSSRWNSILIHYIGDLILNRGFDGVFLDTLEDIEFKEIPKETKSILINAAIRLLSRIRQLYPDCIIVQNNGIGRLLPLTIKLIDGVCWENPLLPIEKLTPALGVIDNLCKTENIRLMLLYEEQYKNYAYTGLSQKYPLYISPDKYL